MAKRSRRARRQAREQRTESSGRSTPTQSSSPAPVSSTPEPVADYGPVNSRGVNLVQEYFYVYVDLRNILLVAVLMVAVLIGLSLVI